MESQGLKYWNGKRNTIKSQFREHYYSDTQSNIVEGGKHHTMAEISTIKVVTTRLFWRHWNWNKVSNGSSPSVHCFIARAWACSPGVWVLQSVSFHMSRQADTVVTSDVALSGLNNSQEFTTINRYGDLQFLCSWCHCSLLTPANVWSQNFAFNVALRNWWGGLEATQLAFLLR